MKKILTVFSLIMLFSNTSFSTIFADNNQEKQELTQFEQLIECIKTHPEYSEAQKEAMKKYIEQLENEYTQNMKEKAKKLFRIKLIDRLFSSQTGW